MGKKGKKGKKTLEWDNLKSADQEPKTPPATDKKGKICCEGKGKPWDNPCYLCKKPLCSNCGSIDPNEDSFRCLSCKKGYGCKEKDTYREAFESVFKKAPLLILCKCGDELNTDYEKRVGMCYMCEEKKKESAEKKVINTNIHIGPKEEVVQENPGGFVTFVRKVPKICAHLAYLGMGAWALYTGDKTMLGSAGSLMIAVWIFVGG